MKCSLCFTTMIIIFSLAACEGSTAAMDTPESMPAVYAGMSNPFDLNAALPGSVVYKTNCASCHGPQGDGDGPAGAALVPAPKNLATLQAEVGDDYLYWRIASGKDGTAMVAWKGVLSDEQIWQVVSFLRTLKSG